MLAKDLDAKMPDHSSAVAVLCSGGLDSAVLLAVALREHPRVHPLYIQCGLRWEAVERDYLERFLHAIARPGLAPLSVLQMPVADLYEQHWSLTGEKVPDADSPDEAVYLPGRNVLLLGKAMIWCQMHRVPTLLLGILSANPFPDATPEFFARFQAAVNQGIDGQIEIRRPFAGLKKSQVLHHAAGLPLELTFSCIQPVNGRHCGRCNKCEERRRAFAAESMSDPTAYDFHG
jgi:7-cyano-7-deazaguanine synthase